MEAHRQPGENEPLCISLCFCSFCQPEPQEGTGLAFSLGLREAGLRGAAESKALIQAQARRGSPRRPGAGLAFCEMPNFSFSPSFALPRRPLACFNGGPCPRGAQSRLCPGSQEEGSYSGGEGFPPPPALTGPILPQLTEGCPARGRTALNSQVPLSWQVESVNKSWGEEMGEKNGVHITLHSSGPRIWKLLSRSMRK